MVRTLLLLTVVIALVACSDGSDETIESVAATPPIPAEAPLGEEPIAFDDLLTATESLDTYRFTWLIELWHAGSDSDGTAPDLVRIAGAVDRTAESVVWHVDLGRLGGADSNANYTVLRLGDRRYTRGLANTDAAEGVDLDGFLPTEELPGFPDWIHDPERGPARLPSLLFAQAGEPEATADGFSATLDLGEIPPESRRSVEEALDIEFDDDLLTIEARLRGDLVAGLRISGSASGSPGVEIAIEPDASVEFPDVGDTDPMAWWDEFIEAFMAYDDGHSSAAIDEAPRSDGQAFAVPDVSGLGADAAFCTIYGNLPYRWATDAIVPAQLWLDHAIAATDVTPPEIEEPFEVMLGFWEQRMDWHFTGGERPPFTDAMEFAERAVARWAVDNCDLPQIPLTTPVTPGYSEFTCDFERRWLDDAQTAYFAEFGTYATHLHVLETNTDTFIATDHIQVGAADDDGYEVVIVPGGACDEG